MSWLQQHGTNQRVIDSFHELIAFMDGEDHSHMLPTLRQYTHKLDTLRNEDVHAVFPELREAFLD